MEKQPKAPYAVASLVLGICSLVLGCFVIGLVCGIIGLILALKGQNAMQDEPGKYSGSGMLTAGKVCSIIGIVLGGLGIIYFFFALVFLGSFGLFGLALL